MSLGGDEQQWSRQPATLNPAFRVPGVLKRIVGPFAPLDAAFNQSLQIGNVWVAGGELVYEIGGINACASVHAGDIHARNSFRVYEMEAGVYSLKLAREDYRG
jgi:hypothetical protein